MAEKFPYVFDLNWDLKNHRDAINRLKRLKEERIASATEYKEIHRTLRENGYSVEGLSPEIDGKQ